MLIMGLMLREYEETGHPQPGEKVASIIAVTNIVAYIIIVLCKFVVELSYMQTEVFV